ncbi:hypothetical protein EMCRGX_G008084 [Ephydatia muelleri]
MPALRKVSQFVSHKADYGCSRCKFKAEREPSMRGSSGNMSYLTSIVAPNRTKEETTSQSKEYLLAKSKTEALSIQKKNETELTYSMSLSLMLPHGPSEGIGLHLQLSVFQVAFNWWLALDTSSGSAGPLCRESVLHPLGHHAFTCKRGGDIATLHNKIAEACCRAHLTVKVE